MKKETAKSLSGKNSSLRQVLIDRSIEILETNGLNALTLRAAARAAGVSHTAPYRHFADKDTLLAAVAEIGFRDLAAAMDRAVKRNPKRALRAIGLAYVGFARQRPALYRLMFGPALAATASSAELEKARNAAFSQCTNIVTATFPVESDSDSGNVADLAIATWSLVHGLASLLVDGRIALPSSARSQEQLIERVLSAHSNFFKRMNGSDRN